jgi:D-alanyl-D-alanine carboxypeptidase
MTNSAERRRLWRSLGIPAGYPHQRGMPLQREARRLVSIGPAADDGKPLKMSPRAAAAWKQMQAAATTDGVTLLPISAFRSVARQVKLVRRKLAAGERIEDILRIVAAPGCSEHHTGRALDLGSPDDLNLDVDFEKTEEFRWLKKRAAQFGFRLSYPRKNRHGISYEPWHWCWHAN